ncbi:MAG: HNH endonuclease [Rhizobium sp.]|nr:HNH endonuclease [Rhizobium sp.]
MIKIDRPACPHPASLQNKTSYKHAENKAALIASTHGKCMYCEAHITHTQFGDVEHIKPKAVFTDQEFEWSNLGFCCSVCNNSKGDSYEPTGPMIDPYAEDPSQYIFAYGPHLLPLNNGARARVTIETVKLNRPQLLEKRTERIGQLEKLIGRIAEQPNETLRRAAIDIVFEETSSKSEYSFTGRTAALSLLEQIAGVGVEKK